MHLDTWIQIHLDTWTQNTLGYMDTNTPGYMDTNTPELKTLEYDILNPDLLINLKIKFTRKTSKI